MSLPQTDEHTCQTCALKVGETCKRKRHQNIGHCVDWVSSVGREKKGYSLLRYF